MSGNVHPNPSPVFLCSVCVGNVTRSVRLVQCCICSKLVHLKCSLLFLSRFKILGSSHSWSCPHCCVLGSAEDSTPTNTVNSPRTPPACILHCATWPICPPCANAAPPPHPCFQISYPPSTHFVSSPSEPSPPLHASGCFSIPLLSSSPLTCSGFFNEMLEVSEPGALNYYTLFRLILLTLFVSRNLTLTHLPLSGSLDSLLCDLIAPSPGLAFFLPIPGTLAAVSLFSSGRAYPSLNFLPPLFLRFTPTLIV